MSDVSDLPADPKTQRNQIPKSKRHKINKNTKWGETKQRMKQETKILDV